MLLFDAAPPLTSAVFLERCEVFLEPRLVQFLRELSIAPRALPKYADPAVLEDRPKDRPSGPRSVVMAQYARWEIALRNMLAKLRGAKLGLDPEPDLVKLSVFESTAETSARNAFGMSDPLERELSLDRARWAFFDDLEWRHLFDFEALCIYRCKLLILEKWTACRAGDPAKNLTAAAARAEHGPDPTQKE